MHVFKLGILLAGLLLLGRYVPICYNSSEYKQFVQFQTEHARSETALKQLLLHEAAEYSLPVTESDIRIHKAEGVLRVTVDYSVPVNLIVYNPELKFHVTSQASR